MNDDILIMIERYRSLGEILSGYRRENLPIGTKVIVNQVGRYVGPGVVRGASDAPDKVAVQIPNGNVWWYDLENVRKEAE